MGLRLKTDGGGQLPTYALYGHPGSSPFFLQQYCSSIKSYASPLCRPSSSILMQISLSQYNPLALNIYTLVGFLLMLISAFNLLQLLSPKCLWLLLAYWFNKFLQHLKKQISAGCFWGYFCSWILKLRIPMAAQRLVQSDFIFYSIVSVFIRLLTFHFYLFVNIHDMLLSTIIFAIYMHDASGCLGR